MALQAVILAGGKGSRLLSRSNNLPKPMVPVLGKPLLQYQIELCAKQGITDIQILVEYRSEAIQEYFGDGSSFGVAIEYHKESDPRGTAGALLDIVDSLNDQFLVLYGDTFLDVDFNKMWSFHIDRKADATLFLHPNDHPKDSDLVEVNSQSLITNIYTYPHDSTMWYRNLVNAALYILNKSALIEIDIPMQNPDIAKHLFPRLLKSNKSLYGYISTEYIKDMGTPDRLDCVEQDVISGKVNSLSRGSKKQAFFIDRDGVINQEVNHLSSADQLELIPGVGRAISKINKAGILVVVITNQPVVARGELTEEGLRIVHNKMETLLGHDGAYVDAIYYCPHHPDKGFDGEISELKKECECRKPLPGLIIKAAKELNISLSESWLVGDSTSDILSAKHAGVRSILVRTGYAGRDGKYVCTPDYVAYDLEDAVDWSMFAHTELTSKAKLHLTKVMESRVVLIGGLARCGKSSLAQIFCECAQQHKKNVKIFSMDNWLIPENKRSTTGGVLDRFNMESIVDFVCLIKDANTKIKYSVQQYDRLTKSFNSEPFLVRIEKDDIVIIEGVPALCDNQLLEISDLSFYIDCDEKARKYKMLRDYLWRGLSKDQFEILYTRREKDEHSVIRKSMKNADFIIQNS
jgi:histidinol-phosphate phosphatase family protein